MVNLENLDQVPLLFSPIGFNQKFRANKVLPIFQGEIEQAYSFLPIPNILKLDEENLIVISLIFSQNCKELTQISIFGRIVIFLLF